jgi:hypothetical protein
MFCAPGFIFDSTERVVSRFHVLRSRTRFWRYRRRRVQFSCYALLDTFSTGPRALGPDIMNCAPGLIFGGIEGVVSRFHVLRSKTHFRWYRRRRVPFSCFVLPDSFSAGPRASGEVYMFCALELIFDGIVGIRSRFHVLRSGTHFRRYRGRRVQFSCFALQDPYSAVPTTSGPVFLFCAPGPILGGIEGVRSRFLVMRSRTHFRRY